MKQSILEYAGILAERISQKKIDLLKEKLEKKFNKNEKNDYPF